MKFEQLSALIFPKLRRPEPVNRKPRQAPTVSTETTSPGSQTPPASTPDAVSTPPASVLYDPQFPQTMERMQGLLQFVGSHPAQLLTHATLETELTVLGRDLLRVAMEEHFLLRALTEEPLPAVVDAQGIAHTTKEPRQTRPLVTRFGPIGVMRLAYRHKGTKNLYPADAVANLPPEKYSHGLREIAAKAAVQGSFDTTVQAIADQTGQQVGKRQVEQLVRRAAQDVDRFYPDATRPKLTTDQALILSVDGKGIVMRTKDLRPSTAAKRAKADHKLQSRLSPGEKSHRKRMAEVGAVYGIDPVVRIPSDILHAKPVDPTWTKKSGPKAVNQWLVASVADSMGDVIYQVLEEAERRDPQHEHPWVALVDGNHSQLTYLQEEASARGIDLQVFLDFIHVLEYLWKAAWCFFPTGDPEAETWVLEHGLEVLQGKASQVAEAIDRQATAKELTPSQRKAVDQCAHYFLVNRQYLQYPQALEKGWPIATGIIEGACRHLIKDRFDITGARWGLDGAEALLKLRSVWSNGDWDAYWTYHLEQEQRRVHFSQYAAEISAA